MIVNNESQNISMDSELKRPVLSSSQKIVQAMLNANGFKRKPDYLWFALMVLASSLISPKSSVIIFHPYQ